MRTPEGSATLGAGALDDVVDEIITLEFREDLDYGIKGTRARFTEPVFVVGPVGTVGHDVSVSIVYIHPRSIKGGIELVPLFFRAVTTESELWLEIQGSEITGELEGVTSIEVDREI